MVKKTWYDSFNPKFAQRVEEDPLNKQNKRNLRNSGKRGYNCAGYALRCYSWYCPYGVEHESWDFSTIPLETVIDRMLEDFKGKLRRISSCKECKFGEYVIAFRSSSRDDFHYARRGWNGTWYHKMGNRTCIQTMTTKEIFADTWFRVYDGELVLFAMKT